LSPIFRAIRHVSKEAPILTKSSGSWKDGESHLFFLGNPIGLVLSSGVGRDGNFNGSVNWPQSIM